MRNYVVLSCPCFAFRVLVARKCHVRLWLLIIFSSLGFLWTNRSGSVCLDVINQTWSPMFGMFLPKPPFNVLFRLSSFGAGYFSFGLLYFLLLHHGALVFCGQGCKSTIAKAYALLFCALFLPTQQCWSPILIGFGLLCTLEN